jgi:hypothetical protein
MGMRFRVPRRVGRGALIALAVLALGTATTAGASDTGRESPAGRATTDQQPGGAEATPIPSGGASRSASEAAPGDVTALAASGLTYSTVTPCRLFDTRQTGLGTIGAGRPYVGYDLIFQGGCGVPADGSVKAVMVNLIAVNTRGTGYVRAAEYPLDPNSGATVLNFNNNLVTSNAIPINMCDTATATCDADLGFLVNLGSGHFVFDLVGYFSS